MAAKLWPCYVDCGSEADKKAAPRLEAGRGDIFIDSYHSAVVCRRGRFIPPA